MTPSHTYELKGELALEIRINPEYESLVPPMTKGAFESLVSSILADGQHERITVNSKGEVLDGHHRLKACQLLQLKADFEVKTFDNHYMKSCMLLTSTYKEDSSQFSNEWNLV